MRPFNILKDKYFRKYSRFLNSVEGYIKPAKPWKARENVDNIAGALRETLKDEIADECDYYTASADIWTSKSKRAFISFTLHYLTRNFDLKNWVLEIKSMSCLAHVLHLIVGAGIVKKKSDQAAKAMLAAAKFRQRF
ncbi:hypothetical protein PHYSODRAFT_523775 [Phytophthora sojae]|uniref:DUF659 domain-containing protein n=1 Tax=Phytophthora sojae (strain P6497) TaxID=1094619 RepID=G5A436_PHYSP|nr:hypothetical protein PHYSODRAFT_523775 [Phytophthora sojae]EGZ09482.1 hypothetical protein PHYSODRAFT_523775 [Phytophthora sojae]|eukprot:XP_009534343.1 hypothetical protein PHYSODRAFT_523775 [Phytophthora sojae]